MAGVLTRPVLICTLALAQFVLLTHPATVYPNHSRRTIPCRTAENASGCYWTHGRLAAYNGTPAFRLWKIGTRRLLGISSGPSAEKRDPLDNEHPELPDHLQQAFTHSGTRVFADFEVCPLEPEQPGTMQTACIEAANHILVSK